MTNQEKKHRDILFLLPRKVESISRSGILLCAFLVIIYCIWTLNRGFEITDEAYYLLLAMHSSSVKSYISAQQWVTAGLWKITGSITMFRAVGMLLLLASSTLLALGALSAYLRFGFVTVHFKSKSVVAAGTAVGAMLYASTINFSPCYNQMASTGAYAAAGLVLLASVYSNHTLKYILYIFAGCAVAIEGICKPSAGLSTLVLLILWVGYFENLRIDKIFGAVAVVFAMVTFAGVILLVNTTIFDAIQSIEQGMQLFRMVQIEGVGARLIRYIVEYWSYIIKTFFAFTIPIIAMIFYAFTRRVIFAQLGLAALVVTLIFGSLAIGLPTFSIKNATFDSYLFGGFNRYDVQLVAIFAMLVMALIASIQVWSRNKNTFILTIGLVLLPYSVAIGTGNVLFTQVIDSLAPWGALISVLVIAGHRDSFNKMIVSLIGFCFIGTIALQIFTSCFRPYHLSSTLAKQDRTVIIGNLGKVKVDAETFRFVTDLNAAAKKCDIEPGAPFIGLYNIPGVSLVLQSIPVLTPWLNNLAQSDFVFERVSLKKLNSVVLALQMEGDRGQPPLSQQFSAFPLGYRYCGMTTYPYMQQSIQIWQSQTR